MFGLCDKTADITPQEAHKKEANKMHARQRPTKRIGPLPGMEIVLGGVSPHAEDKY